MVESGGLENRYPACRDRGFESLALRINIQKCHLPFDSSLCNSLNYKIVLPSHIRLLINLRKQLLVKKAPEEVSQFPLS